MPVTTVSADRFSCPGCGGELLYDPDSQKMLCTHCGSRQPIASERIEAPEYGYDPSTDSYTAPDWSTQSSHTLSCTGCGAQIVLPPNAMTAVCPFCGSHYVRDCEGSTTGILPETLSPFRISRARAAEAFRAWMKKRFWAPKAFRESDRRTAELQGVYIPFWTFDAALYSRYSGQGGRDRTVTHTRTNDKGETETYTTTETDWYSISGSETLSFDDIKSCASSKLDRRLLNGLGAFSLKYLQRYTPEYLAGFVAERYDIGVGEAWQTTSRTMEQQMEAHVESCEGYDHYRFMQYDHRFADIRFKHILLPVWMSSQTYKNKVYPFLLNGETGMISGRSPVSVPKVLLTVALSVLGLALLCLLIAYLCH